MQTLVLNRTNGRNRLKEFAYSVGLAIESSILTHQRLLDSEMTLVLIATVAEAQVLAECLFHPR